MTTQKHTPGPWACLLNGNCSDKSAPWVVSKYHANTPGELNAYYEDLPETGLEGRANAHLISAAPELLAYAECEEAKRLSLLPTSKGGTGNSQSYMEVFTRHGWDGRDVYGFLDGLRRDALKKARGQV